ncbi:hypothetical protein AB6E04_16575 [Vibrio amylolyticus]|uniref:hypothetical protein n=1 Tax=Vibrio amylolyticus TaxID=2847292 RepID=UPI0035542758
MKILYIVHDLNDPAVKRRVSMFRHGGAEVTVVGFYRGKQPKDTLCGCQTLSIGETFDASFAQRILKVILASVKLKQTLKQSEKFDVIIARNLDMLAIGNRARSILGTPLVYECLDIHRFLINKNWLGKVFRSLEKKLCQSVSLLLTSSQGFIDEYFDKLSLTSLPYHILENKVFSTEALPIVNQKLFNSEQITITWNGAIRCHRSLEILSEVTRRLEGKVKVTIWGKPAYTEFSDFDSLVENEPYIEFKGAYRFPDDLDKIYQQADFNWTLDFFEEGGNSEWLLPNRIYEGGLFNVPPIYRDKTFMAKTLQGLGLGFPLKDNFCDELVSFLKEVDDSRQAKLCAQMRTVPSSRWAYDEQQCQALLRLIANSIAKEPLKDHQGLARVSK